MIFAKIEGEWPGSSFPANDGLKVYRLECAVASEQSLESVELLVNGRVAQRFEPENKKTNSGSFETRILTEFHPEESSWVAWRCFEKRPAGRFRFAHTAPWYFEVPGKPLRPRRVETDWLIERVKEEIERSRGIAPEEFLQEYKSAQAIYEQIAKTAR